MTDREWVKVQHPGLVESEQIIEIEPEVDLEFKIKEFELSAAQSLIGAKGAEERNKAIEALLKDGWQIHELIVCPPQVMIIFSREKEEKETTSNE